MPMDAMGEITMGGCKRFGPTLRFITVFKAIILWSIITGYGCQSPAEYRKQADDVAKDCKKDC